MKPSTTKTMAWTTMTAQKARLGRSAARESGRESAPGRGRRCPPARRPRSHRKIAWAAKVTGAPARRRRSDRAACWRCRSPGNRPPNAHHRGSCPSLAPMAAKEAPTMPHRPKPERKAELAAAAHHQQRGRERPTAMTPKCCMVIGRLAPHAHVGRQRWSATASADEANIRVLLLWVRALADRQQRDVAHRTPRHAAGRHRCFLQPCPAVFFTRPSIARATLVARLPCPQAP